MTFRCVLHFHLIACFGPHRLHNSLAPVGTTSLRKHKLGGITLGLRRSLGKLVERTIRTRLGAIETRIARLEQRPAVGLSAQAGSFGAAGIDAAVASVVRSNEDVSLHRENLVPSLGQNGPCLEIGAYFRPMVRGRNARYFDVFTTEELRKRAEVDVDPAVSKHTIPEIHYCDPDGDISVIKERFREVASSHCIEHQPDLIAHLEKVHDLLEPGGRYVVYVPDKRYCYDHVQPLSTVGDVLQASLEKRTRHTLASHVKRAACTHNDALRHWRGDHFDAGYLDVKAKKTDQLIKMFESASGKYLDCHAWYFTPTSFAEICNTLHRLGKIRMRITTVGETRMNTLEFPAIFERD